MFDYDSVDYAASRLKGTVVRGPNAKPYFVHNLDRRTNVGIVAHCVRLDRAAELQVFQYAIEEPLETFPLSSMNLEPAPLGFIFQGKWLSWASRVPMRSDYRQGSRLQNCRAVWGNDFRLFSNRAIYNTICNYYPPFELALDISINEGFPSAFSRNFAIDVVSGVCKLFYKWYGSVGNVVNGQPRLDESYSYLLESLEEDLR